MKEKIKIKILQFLITQNNFYDRERLADLAERPLFSVLYCMVYRKFLKVFSKDYKKKYTSNSTFIVGHLKKKFKN
jgi:hypothetical protein